MLFKVSPSVAMVRARPLSCLSPQYVVLNVVPGALASFLACYSDRGFKMSLGYYGGMCFLHVMVVTVAYNSCVKASV